MSTALAQPFPDIFVELGLGPNTNGPSQASTSLRLGDATFGLLNTGTLGSSPSWFDISRDVRNFTINRAMTRDSGPLWSYQSGTSSIVLDNSDGTYDPDNTGSPYTGQLYPMLPVRIRANFQTIAKPLYFGYADGFIPGDVTTRSDYAELVLSATDAMKVLGGVTLAQLGSATGTGATTGARVKDILTRAGWYTSAEFSKIDTGDSTLQGTTLGDTALSLIQLAVASEIGQLYVDGTGAIVFRHRQALLADTRSNTVQAVFGDSPGTSHTAGTELAVASFSRANDDTTTINDIQATRAGGTMQEVTDSASILKYLFPRTYANSNLILQTDVDALHWAQWVISVGRNPENRFESITINPLSDSTGALWIQALTREIGDRIQIWHRPSSVASPITKDCFVMGVTHSVDTVASSWTTTFTLQDATKYGSFFVLNNPTLGVLNSNALAF